MKPCDCKDHHTMMTRLNEQAISFNNLSLTLSPAFVIIEHGPCTLKMSQSQFKRLAEWYLTDQIKELTK